MIWRRFLFRRRRSSYPLAGCSPAEPASVSLDDENLAGSWARSIVVPFKICRGPIAQGAVEALAIVKHFDVIEDCLPDLSEVRKLAPVNQLQFERAPKRFHRRVVGDHAAKRILRKRQRDRAAVEQRLKFTRGGLDFLARMPLTPFSLNFNGQQHESTFAVISNAARYASMFTLAPGARIDDDKFRVCVFNARSRLAWLSHAFLSITGTHTLRRSVVYQETGAAMANSNVEAPVQLDGDIVGKLPMDFEIVPRALRIYAPALGERWKF